MSDIVLTDAEPEEVPPLAAEPLKLNQKQLEALVFHLVVDEGLSGNSVYWRLAREHGMKDLKKANIEKVGDQLAKAWADAPPAVQARMRLEAAEMQLQGDLLVVLGELTPTNPRDIRDVIDHIGQVGAQGVAEHQLRSAVDYLEEAEHPRAAEMKARFLELFPETDDE